MARSATLPRLLTHTAGWLDTPAANSRRGEGLLRQPLDGEGRPREGDAAATVQMQPFAEDRFMDADGPMAGRGASDFLVDNTGAVGWARVGGRAFPRIAE